MHHSSAPSTNSPSFRLQAIQRRALLKTAAWGIPLPMLESLASSKSSSREPHASAKRLVCVGYSLGFYKPLFYPKQAGRNYTISPTLKPIESHRRDFTVFSGLDHRAPHGHHNWANFLCGQRVGDISLDQIVAEKTGPFTKIPSLQLSGEMSYNRQGIKLPALKKPSVVFKKIFMSKQEQAQMQQILASGRSHLDKIVNQTQSLKKDISSADQHKLDEYLTALREVEVRMSRESTYLKEDPPQTDYKLPPYDPISPSLALEAQSLMYDLIALALQTDTTRVAAMMFGGTGVLSIRGQAQKSDYHTLSHHRENQPMIDEFVQVDLEHMKALNKFLQQLKDKKDAEGKPLLDSTLVLVGTGMGDSNIHSNADCPTLVAGGGLPHGSHIQTNPSQANAPLLGDLYLTLLNQLGIESNTFSNAHRRMEIQA